MLDKMERKLGRFAIPHLMRYLIFGQVLVYFIALFKPEILLSLNLIPAMVLKGQVWRLFTFVFCPTMESILMMVITLFCYYWIGEALERSWGSFRFNLFVLLGWLSVMACLFLFAEKAVNIYDMSNVLLDQMGIFYQSMFIALASIYPELRILLFYFIPMKAKWAGWISVAFLVLEFVRMGFVGRMLMLFSFIPYAIFFGPILFRRLKAWIRKRKFEKASGIRSDHKRFHGAASGRGSVEEPKVIVMPERMQNNGVNRPAPGATPGDADGNKVAFHRCCVCGLTELDDPNMTFRYCSQCNGNYEYCENHIHNHEHVK